MHRGYSAAPSRLGATTPLRTHVRVVAADQTCTYHIMHFPPRELLIDPARFAWLDINLHALPAVQGIGHAHAGELLAPRKPLRQHQAARKSFASFSNLSAIIKPRLHLTDCLGGYFTQSAAVGGKVLLC